MKKIEHTAFIMIVTLGLLLGALDLRGGTIQFTDSEQLNLVSRRVLAAVNFCSDTSYTVSGTIQGATIQNKSTTTSDGDDPIALTIGGGATLTPVLPGDASRGNTTWPWGQITGTGGDEVPAEDVAEMIHRFAVGETGSLSFAFGANLADTAVEVQLVGGDGWWGPGGGLEVSVGGVPQGVIPTDKATSTVHLLTFDTTLDVSGNLVIDLEGVEQASGIAGVFVTANYAPVGGIVHVETAADGSGTIVPAATLTSGDTVTAYAIARETNGAFLANVPVPWSMTDVTGFVRDEDLVGASDGKSAVFTAGGFGSGRILATEDGTNHVPSEVITVEASPVAGTNGRPFIWMTMADRQPLLNKIASNTWASAMADDLIAGMQGELASYESDPDAYLRQIPVDWSVNPPVVHTDWGFLNNAWQKLDVAKDCAVIYYMTGNPRYAALAGAVLHNWIDPLSNTPVGNVSWAYGDNLSMLDEGWVLAHQSPIIYDLLYGYLSSNQVYEVESGGMASFSTATAQYVFDTYYNLIGKFNAGAGNWSANTRVSMLHNVLGLDDSAARDAAIRHVIDVRYSDPENCVFPLSSDASKMVGDAPYATWDETLDYGRGVMHKSTYLIALIDRYNPAEDLLNRFSVLPDSVHRLSQFCFPNGSQAVAFGDGPRSWTPDLNYPAAEVLYHMAKRVGRADLMRVNGGIIADGLASGAYTRSTVVNNEGGWHMLMPSVLSLLWGEPEVSEVAFAYDLSPRTDTMPHAGIALQRNVSPNGDPDYGLMTFVGGAAFVHSHASGMSMELYGMGTVLGGKRIGRETYDRTFAANNTVVVNGASRGQGGWKSIAINTVQVEAMEPAARQDRVSSNITFTCSSFLDDKAGGAEADQQRTMAIVRTSPTTGYYVDIYRTDSSLANEYHDYIYHNIGDSMTVTDSSGAPLTLTDEPGRFPNVDGVNPGWGAFTNVKSSATVTDSVRVRFDTAPTGGSTIHMDLHIPGDSAREYATAMSPELVDAAAPYDTALCPTLVVRKDGEAWDSPFAVVYEPHWASAAGSVTNVTKLVQNGVVVGMKVKSLVNGSNITQYVISNPEPTGIYENTDAGIRFEGRFAVVSDTGSGNGELYIGEGSDLEYGSMRIRSQSGADTQASMQYTNYTPSIVNANDPVYTESNVPPVFAVDMAVSGLKYSWEADTGLSRSGALPYDLQPGDTWANSENSYAFHVNETNGTPFQVRSAASVMHPNLPTQAIHLTGNQDAYLLGTSKWESDHAKNSYTVELVLKSHVDEPANDFTWLDVGGFKGFSLTTADLDEVGDDGGSTTRRDDLRFIQKGGSAQELTVDLPNTWTSEFVHIVVLYDGEAGTMAVYIDGTLAASRSDAPFASYGNWEGAQAPALLGNMLDVGGGLGTPTAGGDLDMADGAVPVVRFYERALSADEVTQNHRHLSIADAFRRSDATANTAYSDTITGVAVDPDGDPLTYAKVSGPAWLGVASDGTLSGTPGDGDVGLNSFIVSVSDGINPAVGATLTVHVGNFHFMQWSGGHADMDRDSNGDGISDGLAWLLGAADPAAVVSGKLPDPEVAHNADLAVQFDYLVAANRGTAVLCLQYSHDLGETDPWASHTVEVPETSGTVGGIDFVITPNEDTNQVSASIPASGAGGTGTLFGRLMMQVGPSG